MDESKEINVVDVKIVPDRYLKPDTCEKILNEIYELEGLIRVLVHGPSLAERSEERRVGKECRSRWSPYH